MDQHAFERLVLRMWTSTRIPLTRANVLAFTGARRDRAEAWLDAMSRDSVLEMDSDADGEVIWIVRGSERPTTGPRTVAEAQTLDRLRREADGRDDRRIAVRPTTSTLSSRQNASAVADEKSLLASGILSLVFGPLGWLYAAPLREALPATFAYMLMCAIVPHVLLPHILGITAPLSALIGLAYAWRYNKHGQRMPMLSPRPALPPGSRRS